VSEVHGRFGQFHPRSYHGRVPVSALTAVAQVEIQGLLGNLGDKCGVEDGIAIKEVDRGAGGSVKTI
jgi:hypothetical protein